jgi:hypothetical protein
VTLTVLLRILEFKDKSDFSQDEMSKKVDSFDEWSVVRNKANFKKMVVIIAGVMLRARFMEPIPRLFVWQ